MKYIEELISYQKNIDAIQISEILWLSQFMDNSSENIEASTPPLNVSEPLEDIEDEINEEEEQDYSIPNNPQKERGDYGFDKNNDTSSIFSSTNITKEEKLPNIDKQFSSLKVKQKSISNSLLDDSKTADYIATTGYFHPIFKEDKSKKSYFNLHIIIDQSESILLWKKSVEHFIKSVKFSTNFKSIQVFNLESNQDNITLSFANSNRNINANSALFRDEQSITLVFSDIVGKAWKTNNMFKVLEQWSKGSFVAIVSMLPKRMWKKTPLRQGVSLFTKSTKLLPKNKDLKAEFSFMNKEDNKQNINIPLLTFDSNTFSYLSDVLISKKDSWIDTRIFKNLIVKEIKNKKIVNISPKERVEKFFSFALPKVRQLAIYCSVLPLNQEIIREVIRVKELGSEKDVFSEFYFGGLLDKDNKAEIGEYKFYDGVAKELRRYISMQEAEILFKILSDVIGNSLGVKYDLNLLYEANIDEPLSDSEKLLAEMMIEVLEDKGSFYEEKIESLSSKIETIEEVQPNSSLESVKNNEIILYKEDTLDINLDLVVDYLNKICNYLTFKVGEAPFIVEDEIISTSSSYEKLDKFLYEESENSLRSILFTEKPYDNNYFFEPNDSYHNLRIVSFSGWDTLTTLPKNNGLVYFIGWLVALISDSFSRHYESTGCIYDFSGNKTDIDKNMREPYIRQNCFDVISLKNAFFNNEILDDLNSILDFVGKASKNDLDVFAKGYEIEASIVIQLEKNGWGKSSIIQEYKLPNSHRADLLLHYKDKNLAVIEVKSPRNEAKTGLKQAINYGSQLNIDYVYATSGLEIYEYSIDKQKGKIIDKYPSPEELWERYNTPKNRLRDYPYLNNNLKRHHKEAIITIIEGIINDNKRI